MRANLVSALAFAIATGLSSEAYADWFTLRDPLAYDADTIYATAPAFPTELADISIRVRGIDAPEIKGKCPAEKAKAIEARDFVRDLLSNSATVSLTDIEWDKYGGRVLATVHINGRDLAALLIAQGLGRPYDGQGKRQPWC